MQEKNQQLNKKRIIHKGCDTTEINLGGCEYMTLNLSEHAYRRAFERIGLEKSGVKIEMRRLLGDTQMEMLLDLKFGAKVLIYVENSDCLIDQAVLVLIPDMHDITLKTFIDSRDDGFKLRDDNICFFYIDKKLEQTDINTFVAKVGNFRWA